MPWSPFDRRSIQREIHRQQRTNEPPSIGWELAGWLLVLAVIVTLIREWLK